MGAYPGLVAPPPMNVGKVSTRFEYFASRFASLSELALIQAELGAEFDSKSNSDIFRQGFRSKNGISPGKILIFQIFSKSIWRPDSLYYLS